jgi:hypothetical protein
MDRCLFCGEETDRQSRRSEVMHYDGSRFCGVTCERSQVAFDLPSIRSGVIILDDEDVAIVSAMFPGWDRSGPDATPIRFPDTWYSAETE